MSVIMTIFSFFRRDNAHILKILLAKGPWFDLVNFNMCSVLHVAVNKGHFSCVTTLVEHGCNVNVKVSILYQFKNHLTWHALFNDEMNI